MSKRGHLKFYDLSPEAQGVVLRGLEAHKSYRQISLDVLRATQERISENALSNYRRQVWDSKANVLEFLKLFFDQIIQHAPDPEDRDNLDWLQNWLNALLKNKTADLLIKGNVPPDELLRYFDAAERRSLERKRLEIHERKLAVEEQKLETDRLKAEATLKVAERKLAQISNVVDKSGGKQVDATELEEIIKQHYEI